MTNEQQAIWRKLTDEQRQRVIDARWDRYGVNRYGAFIDGEWCCPLGVAFDRALGRRPSAGDVAASIAGVDKDAAIGFAWTVPGSSLMFTVAQFVRDWDKRRIPPADLVADLRAMQVAS